MASVILSCNWLIVSFIIYLFIFFCWIFGPMFKILVFNAETSCSLGRTWLVVILCQRHLVDRWHHISENIDMGIRGNKTIYQKFRITYFWFFLSPCYVKLNPRTLKLGRLLTSEYLLPSYYYKVCNFNPTSKVWNYVKLRWS